MIPPAPVPMDRTSVLRSVDGPAGAVLWRALNDARLWGAATERDRPNLFRAPSLEVQERFAAACADVPALAPAFGTFALLVQSPNLVTAEQIGSACVVVHKWAEDRGMGLTGLLFAEAAAHAEPDSPARANLAARSARKVALYHRAGAWHYRAAKLGVRAKIPAETVWALIGYGAMMKETGRMAEARKWLGRASRRARALGRRKESAMAHHDLMNIALELGKYGIAESHIRDALALYTLDHPRTPALAHDFAFALLRRHHYTAALGLLERVIPLIRPPDERALVVSSLAWAAAGAGRRERHGTAEAEALRLAGVYDRHAAPTFLHLAEAAIMLGELERARKYADAAQAAGARREETHLVREAAAMLTALAEPVGRPPEDRPPSPETRGILRDLTARVRQWKEAPD